MKVAFRNNMIRLVKSNFTVFRFILIGIVIFFEFDPDLTSLFDIAIKNISLFFIIPLIISLMALFTTYFYDRKKEKELNEGYYRDIIEKISPVELTYIDDYCIESEKDFIATVLELQLKKKVEITESAIKIINENVENLTSHEKFVLKELKNNTQKEKHAKTFGEKFDEKVIEFIRKYLLMKHRNDKDEFRKSLVEDLQNSQLIDCEKEEKLYNATQKLDTKKNRHMVLLTILFIIMVTNDETLFWYLAYIISAVFIIKLMKKFIKFNENKVSKIKNKLGHIVAATLWGFGMYWLFILGIILFLVVLIIMEDYRIVEIFSTIFKYAIVALSILYEIATAYLIITNQQLTNEGKSLKTKLIGLKMFLADYSNMKEKELNEVRLWDEYIIYASILSQNKKIKRQIEKIL